MKPSDHVSLDETYQEYLRCIRKCGFCDRICCRIEPECCDLSKGLTPEQVDKISEIAEDRFRAYMKLGDIACLSCELLSPVMRSVAAKLPLPTESADDKKSL